MITQILDQGINKIRIESAESLEDAEINKFRPGEYSRYFLNDKPIDSYMGLIKHIMDETQKNNKSFIPNAEALIKKRRDMLIEQNNLMRQQLEKLKQTYGKNNISGIADSMLKNLDAMIDKLSPDGVRIKQ